MTTVSTINLVKKPFIAIELDTENEWLYINWLGSANPETGIAGCEDIIQALEKYPVQKILNDNRNLTGSWEDGINWLLQSWFPRFLGVGCFYIAWVQSSCPKGQASLGQALQHEIPNVSVLVFDDLETAASWLKEI
ncbi:hypothetical protein [Adhaeribacter radiodurans]|uniref:STAS/SEC14 domain-containing protein n=1 Tax=Adhaeribacter radiodurans TaxID=2745197 RepID=A0A7L7L9T1_9BACT|nr:hypothetical protein [Adhaeribacter radiodurans]QMU29149.1 hypothetical protein HUW48_14350 [Adhaeribacter radiodurans]